MLLDWIRKFFGGAGPEQDDLNVLRHCLVQLRAQQKATIQFDQGALVEYILRKNGTPQIKRGKLVNFVELAHPQNSVAEEDLISNINRLKLTSEEAASLTAALKQSGLHDYGLPMRELQQQSRLMSPLTLDLCSVDFDGAPHKASLSDVERMCGRYDLFLRKQGSLIVERRLLILQDTTQLPQGTTASPLDPRFVAVELYRPSGPQNTLRLRAGPALPFDQLCIAVLGSPQQLRPLANKLVQNAIRDGETSPPFEFEEEPYTTACSLHQVAADEIDGTYQCGSEIGTIRGRRVDDELTAAALRMIKLLTEQDQQELPASVRRMIEALPRATVPSHDGPSRSLPLR